MSSLVEPNLNLVTRNDDYSYAILEKEFWNTERSCCILELRFLYFQLQLHYIHGVKCMDFFSATAISCQFCRAITWTIEVRKGRNAIRVHYPIYRRYGAYYQIQGM